jgi:hypothetical protein
MVQVISSCLLLAHLSFGCFIDGVTGSALSSHPAMGPLMEGVQLRLHDSIRSVRACGMDVAEGFSRVIEPKQPLKFDREVGEEPNQQSYISPGTLVTTTTSSSSNNSKGVRAATAISVSSTPVVATVVDSKRSGNDEKTKPKTKKAPPRNG